MKHECITRASQYNDVTMSGRYILKQDLLKYYIKSYLVLISILLSGPVLPDQSYYQPSDYGSDSLYSPFSNFLSYSFDTMQLPDNFSFDNFSDNSTKVFDHLGHPKQAIDSEGGNRAFVNRQIFPVSGEDPNERYIALPNYFLHLLGGGMVYRKDLEWFRAHDYEYSTIWATSLAMTAEVLQEILEKNTTTDDDEVADVYIFRPIGILLFHQDAVANFVMKYLDPAIWPSLQVYDLKENTINNAGINYVYRPTFLATENIGFFAYTGLNNLFGLSHHIGHGESISWGIGASTQKIDFDLARQAELAPSAGIFYDRNKSLLASLVINGTGGNRFRFNYYPTSTSLVGQFGYFISNDKTDRWSTGIVYKIQLGIGFSIR